MPDVTSGEHRKAAGKIRNLLAVYKKNEDLINIGAYVKGSDPNCDEAIKMMGRINEFLQQETSQKFDYEATVNELINLGGM
jgi:flagellum-specific ATP synthase